MRHALALSLLAVATPALAQHDHPRARSQQSQPEPAGRDPHAGMSHAEPGAPPIDMKAGPPTSDPHAGMAHAAGQADPHADHGGHSMSEELTPGEAQSGTAQAAEPHADHGMPAAETAMPGTGVHAGQHGISAGSSGGVGTDAAPGRSAPPPIRADRAADRYFGAAAMAPAQAELFAMHGGMVFSQFIVDLAELRVQSGREAYRWNGEFWLGGDLNRLVVKSEGEGRFGGAAEKGEVQALFSRAIDPYWNLQLGIRQDITPRPGRSYAVLGAEGLAPYWLRLDAALFLADRGDLLGRIEASYDQRLTQRLILQPRAELNLSAQDLPRQGVGEGVSDIELGLRLRYEIAREFAPYLGINWERRLGRSADFARQRGEDTGGASLVLGVRAWF